jgi:hypothetical protein
MSVTDLHKCTHIYGILGLVHNVRVDTSRRFVDRRSRGLGSSPNNPINPNSNHDIPKSGLATKQIL